MEGDTVNLDILEGLSLSLAREWQGKTADKLG